MLAIVSSSPYPYAASAALRLALSQDLGPVDGLLRRCAFAEPTDGPVALAVSGGPDSIAMVMLAKAAGLEVDVWHVDHQIRAGSATEAAAVEHFAQAIGAGFRLVREKVEPGANLEARARELRKSRLPAGIATGHTMDDQAETMLINLLRGAGTRGLAAMEPGPSKPILGLRRSETEAICAALGLMPIRDPSNLSLDFVRNRIRHEVLPLMAEVVSRDLVPILYRSSLLFGQDDSELDAMASSIDANDQASLASAPRVLRRRRLRQVIAQSVGYPPSYEALEALDARVVEGRNFRTQLAGGLDVTCRRGRISYTMSPVAKDASGSRS